MGFGGGSDVAPAPLRGGVTDSNYEEVRGRGGFATGYLLVRRQCGNDRTRCLRFCRDNYCSYFHHDCCSDDLCGTDDDHHDDCGTDDDLVAAYDGTDDDYGIDAVYEGRCPARATELAPRVAD